MAKRRRVQRWADQAALEALLRFGPEVSGLEELQRSARQQFRGSVRGARAAARGTRQAVRAARPQVRDIYDDAQAATQQISDVIGPNMAGVPASLQAAIAQEQTGFSNRMQEAEASALTDLTSRAVAAREGKGAAIRAARDRFADDLTKIFQRRLDLAREQGAFVQLRTGELRQAAQDRADQFALENMRLTQQERNSLRQSGIDPNTGKPIPGGKLDPDANGKPGGGKGSDRATTSQIAAAQDTAQLALSEIRTLMKLGQGRGDIAELLKRGADDVKIDVLDQNGKPVLERQPDGTFVKKTKTIPGLPQIKSQLLLSAALDQAFKGYVSQTNWKRLARRGLRPHDLGFRTYREWKRKAQTPAGPIEAAGHVPILGTLIGG